MERSAIPISQTTPGIERSGDAIVVGSGPAGLACAAMMREVGLAPLVLEKSDTIASVWRQHYDCLHLHSERAFSGLPGLPMPKGYSRFPSRLQVIEYLEAYATKFGISPRYRTEVRVITRNGTQWDVQCSNCSLSAPIIVVAVGWSSFPFRPSYPGLDDFAGRIIHSTEYRNTSPYRGKRVLVVGYGNSGGEIALDLARNRIDTTLSVRGPIQIMPRTILGISTVTLGEFQRKVPARLADLFNTPLLAVTTGNLGKIGLRRMAKGPRRLIAEDNRVPIIDTGTLGKIRNGLIKVRGEVASFTREGVVFHGSGLETFDAVIFATGFRTDLRGLLPGAGAVLDAVGYPLISGAVCNEPGLYFCGTTVSPAGQLREIGIEAKRIALLAKRHLDAARPAIARVATVSS